MYDIVLTDNKIYILIEKEFKNNYLLCKAKVGEGFSHEDGALDWLSICNNSQPNNSTTWAISLHRQADSCNKQIF